MNARAEDFWTRALEALAAGRVLLDVSPDGAASRAYYAAFYAVSAQFALLGKSFKKHSAIEAAVHANLVKAGGWPREFGEEFSRLVRTRSMGDYGGADHVTPEEGRRAVAAAGLLVMIAQRNSEVFTTPADLR